MKVLRGCWLALFIAYLFHSLPMYAQGTYTTERIIGGLNIPVKIAFAPDGSGRLFYNELQTGNVKVIFGDSSQNGTWLHVNGNAQLKRGLLGLTFDPNFTTNHFVYIFYITDDDTPKTRVERYTEVNFRADTTSKLILYEQSIITPCGIGFSHYGGELVFGDDEKLYITIGENACSPLATLTTDPRGKVLRIEPNIPAPFNAVTSNPFYDDGNPFTGNEDRIFAKGLRNPFRMTLSQIDGHLYATDNGPDCNDEVDRILIGRDYGWRTECSSGENHCECSQDSPYTPPLWRTPTYSIAPTGIVHYNDTVYPELYGKIIFVDAVNGYIHAGIFDATMDTLDVVIISQPNRGGLYDLIIGPDGYIYFCHYSGISRILPQSTSVDENVTLPRTRLLQNSPNPFNPETDLRLEIGDWSHVKLKVYDVFGREIAALVDERKSPGSYSITWNASALPSGVYFYRLTTPSFQDTKKMILLK